MKTHLLSLANKKVQKNEKDGYLGAVLHLAPNTVSGRNTCPSSSPSCRKNCLFFGSNFLYPAVKAGTIRKTNMFFDEREKFLSFLHSDIYHLTDLAKKRGMKLSVRLNGTSDIRWFKIDPTIFSHHTDVMFYDYTKNVDVARDFVNNKLPENYHITFSRSETNGKHLHELNGKINIAMVVSPELKETLLTTSKTNHIDGDFTDSRFLEKTGKIVLIKAKSKARSEKQGFVLR